MPPFADAPLPRFASLSTASTYAASSRWGFARLFFAPFSDVDDRVARLAAATKAENVAREVAMSDADAARR